MSAGFKKELERAEPVFGIDAFARGAFAAAAAERCVRRALQRSELTQDENRFATACLAVVNDLRRALIGDITAFERISHALATFYLTPFWRRSYVDHDAKQWMDATAPEVQATHYAVLAFLHLSAEMAARAADHAANNTGDAATAERARQAQDLQLLRERGQVFSLDAEDDLSAAEAVIAELRRA